MNSKRTLGIKILTVISIISILLFALWYYSQILVFAKISVLAVCAPHLDISDEGYVITGVFLSKEVNGNITTEIMVTEDFVNTEYYKPVLKHEECHARQFNQGRLNNCSNAFGLFINEVECYMVQRFYETFN